MIRFNQELSGRLRQLAVECSGAPGFDSITGHRLYATIARERFADMSEGQLAIVEYCAGACIRQDDADVPMAVFDMVYAEEFYLWFEHYHAGNDGNGRVGAILFNLKNGTLAQPVLAPHYRDPRTLAQSSAFGEIEP
jgi:hypothetical protein